MPNMLNFFSDLLFPARCLGCKKEKYFICENCLNKMPAGGSFTIPKSRFLDGLTAASDYNSPLVKKAIFKYKYEFVKELSKPLGLLMAKAIKNNSYLLANAILIPAPLHKRRLRWRGFNQAELLAEEISRQLNIPTNKDILVRGKYTQPQMKIHNAEKRRKNIENAFSIRNYAKGFENKTIILIDDVCSTGATLEQCAKALQPLQPKEIQGLTLASGLS